MTNVLEMRISLTKAQLAESVPVSVRRSGEMSVPQSVTRAGFDTRTICVAS
jgi:YbbR domain-containing protein